MLDDFKESQPIAYKTLKNAGLKSRFSHAYIFETNGFDESQELIKSFVKYLVCPDHHTKIDESQNCLFCQRISNGNYTELKTINPDGIWIKKDQVLELQREFNKKILEGYYKIYIINNADRLNGSSANTILKFLEEPAENIIAILVCENSNQIIETIRSRCQIIKLISHKKISNDNLYEKIDQEIIEKAIEYVNYYEKNKTDSIKYMNQKYVKYFANKENITIFFDIILMYYGEILNKKINKEIENFINHEIEIDKISKNNTLKQIVEKIEVIIYTKEKIKINANTNLLLDKFILELERAE